MGLAGEAGEVCNKIKKVLRGDPDAPGPKSIADELGDTLWYLTALGAKYGYSLDSIIYMNIKKGELRRERETVMGNGDER